MSAYANRGRKTIGDMGATFVSVLEQIAYFTFSGRFPRIPKISLIYSCQRV